jgi:hypothetical protein
MKLTNVKGLPETLLKAISYSGHKKDGFYSVTELLQPPRVIHLKKRHWEEIEEDASDRIWAILGNAVHYILQKGETDTSLVEQTITMSLDGIKVSGTADLYHNGLISDYKTTSVWSVIYKDRKEDWEKQLNMYAMLYRHAGFDVKGLEIVAILRDWSKSEAKRNMDYPQAAVQVIPIKLKSPKETEDMVKELIKGIEVCKDLPDNDLPLCTDKDRWCKDTVWAVMKEGRKSAVKLYDNEHMANEAAEKEKKGYVQERKGKAIRCEDYCSANIFCNQFKDSIDEI